MKKIYETPQLEVTMLNKLDIISTSTETLSIIGGTIDGDNALTKERPNVDFSQDNDFDF